MGDLTKLKELRLYNNHLKALWDHTQDAHGVGNEEGANSKSGGAVPRHLRRLLDVLDRCNDLNLDANPWTEPPESVVIKGATGIRGYFEDLYAEACRIQRNSVKIILVGQEGAGKTSLRQSMKANKAAPTGEWEEESTVFADVEPMELEGASVRVYDCAGQVAYTGLLQMFLTPRSICVLVCNAEAFQNPDQGVGDQVEKDCRKLEELCVCDWLRSISRRVPGNDVIFVATKCDMVGGNPRDTGRRMEEACQQWLASWVRDGMQAVRVEDGVCLTSCFAPRIDVREGGSGGDYSSEGGWACDWRDNTDDNPSPSLLHRLVNQPNGGGLRGAQMVLPRSWGIALTFLEALERGRDPVETIVRKLADPDERESAGTAPSKVEMYRGITVEELSAKWLGAVLELEKREITVANAEHALEGALSIREFDGSLIRHETFVFLDVVWLSRILKPLLNHKDTETFDGFVKLGDNGDSCITLRDQEDIASWLRLKSEGILEPRLAHVIWPAGLSEYVLPTLVSLGLTFPLENDDAGGLVVLLRLKSDRPARVGKVIDTFCSQKTPVFSASWKIFLGVPAGAMEKVLTRCCSIGGVQTFWRFGVLVHGGFGDARDGSGDFAVVLEYSSTNNELTAQIYGDKSQPAPWAALSYVISAMRFVLLEFPGLRWRGLLKCPQHGDPMLLDNKATRIGDPLLLESAGCPQCSPKIRGQGAAAIKLLRMVDIRLERDVVFDEVKARFLECEYFFSHPTTSSEGKEAVMRKMDKRFDDLTTTVTGGFDDTKFTLKGGLGRVADESRRGFGEMARGLDEVTGGLGKLADEMRVGFEEVKGGLDKVTESLQESLRCLKNLQAPNFPYPHLVVVKEVESQGKKRSLLEKLRGKYKKDMALYFLCPVDMSKVPCGVGGEGYRFCKTRDWVKRLSPVLQVAVVTAKVALKATSGIEVDVSDFMQAVNEGLVEEVVDRTLDEETLLRVVSGEEEADTDLQRDTRASFEALKKFMEKEKTNRRKTAKDGDGYINFEDKMNRVDDGKGGLVWVRTENVEQWRETLRSTAAPSG